MIRRPPRSTLFPTRRSSDLRRSARRIQAGRGVGQRARRLALTPACHLDASPSEHYFRRRTRSEEHTSELQSQSNLVCRLLLEKKKKQQIKKLKTNNSTNKQS